MWIIKTGTPSNRAPGRYANDAYIIIGVLIGPNEQSSIAGISLTLVEHREFIDVLAELGIVFLLFFLGLEFSISQLLDDRTRIVKTGVSTSSSTSDSA